MTALRSTLSRTSARLSLFATGMMIAATRVLADFGGPIPSIPGTPAAADEGSLRQAIINALIFVLNFLALLSVIFIVVAGIRLIVSQGEQEQKDKAKKTILYVIIGLLIVLFARVIVGFFTTGVSQIF